MSVVRYTGTAQAIGTRSTQAPLAQRHSDETYTGTRLQNVRKMHKHGLYYLIFLIELTYSSYFLYFVSCRISMSYYFTLFLISRR